MPVRSLAAEPRAGAGRLATAATLRLTALLALVAVLLAPLLVTRIPPLVDYPNHLARMHVLATGAASPALHAMFAIDWAFIPNMAMDLVVPALAQAVPLETAGKLFIALTVLLPPIGAVALHRAWFAGRPGERSPWPWIALLTGANAFLTLGFLNYDVGIGMALLGAAWHARAARPGGWRGCAAAALWGIACLLAHLAAFVLLLLLMVSTEAGRWSRRRLVARALPIAAAAAVPLALYRVFGPARSYASGDQFRLALSQLLQHGFLSDLHERLTWAVAPFAAPWTAATLAGAALVALPLLWAAWRRRLAVAPQMLLALAGLAAAYAILPAQLADNGMMFQRLSLPLVLVAIAGLDPRLPGRAAGALAALVVALLVACSAGRALAWRGQDRLVADIERVIATIPPGARVLAVRDGGDPWHVDPDETGARRALRETIAYQHLGALVTLERDAFYPMIYATAGKQPVRLLPPYEQQGQWDGYLPLTRQLGEAVDVPPPARHCGYIPGQLPCQLWSWPRRYDYVLRLNAHDTPPPDADRLTQVAASGWAVLYRVTAP